MGAAGRSFLANIRDVAILIPGSFSKAGSGFISPIRYITVLQVGYIFWYDVFINLQDILDFYFMGQ